jgi:uncharacterized membrane protein YgcG
LKPGRLRVPRPLHRPMPRRHLDALAPPPCASALSRRGVGVSQVLSSNQPLELPLAKVTEPQAQHLLAKILVKRPKDRTTIEAILRHAYLVGGLDTQQVGGSFAKLHESQSAFKQELTKLQDGMKDPTRSAPGSSFTAGGAASFGGGASSFGVKSKHAKFSN